VSDHRILVVDDDIMLCRAMRRMLRPYTVTVAHGGEEALDILDEEQFDVILCDIMMPGISGPELYNRLESVRPGLQDRVMFITGGALDSVQHLMQDMPGRVIEKPFTRDELLSVIDRFLATLSRS